MQTFIRVQNFNAGRKINIKCKKKNNLLNYLWTALGLMESASVRRSSSNKISGDWGGLLKSWNRDSIPMDGESKLKDGPGMTLVGVTFRDIAGNTQESEISHT